MEWRSPRGSRKWSFIDCCQSLRGRSMAKHQAIYCTRPNVNGSISLRFSSDNEALKATPFISSGVYCAVQHRQGLSLNNSCRVGQAKSYAGLKWCGDKLSTSCLNHLRVISVKMYPMLYPLTKEGDD